MKCGLLCRLIGEVKKYSEILWNNWNEIHGLRSWKLCSWNWVTNSHLFIIIFKKFLTFLSYPFPFHFPGYDTTWREALAVLFQMMSTSSATLFSNCKQAGNCRRFFQKKCFCDIYPSKQWSVPEGSSTNASGAKNQELVKDKVLFNPLHHYGADCFAYDWSHSILLIGRLCCNCVMKICCIWFMKCYYFSTALRLQCGISGGC